MKRLINELCEYWNCTPSDIVYGALTILGVATFMFGVVCLVVAERGG